MTAAHNMTHQEALRINRTEPAPKSTLGLLVALAASVLFLCLACSKPPYVWAQSIPNERALPAQKDQKINRGDSVSVVVAAQATLTGDHVVSTDGTIVIPNLGAVHVADKTPEQAARVLERRLATILGEPKVSLVVITKRIEVGVLGEVAQPGKYMVKSGDGVVSAIAMAGGLTAFANDGAIYLVRSTEPLRIRFRMKDLTRGGNSARSFALRDGDLLIVE